MAAIKNAPKKDVCPQELQSSKDLEKMPMSGFSREHLEIDLDEINKELILEKTYINDLQAYCVNPPSQTLCDHIASNVNFTIIIITYIY